MNARRDFYVYWFIDPRDGSPFYIGKGSGRRIHTRSRNPLVDARCSELGHTETREIVADELTEAAAYSLEHDLIAKHRATLLNVVDGSDRRRALQVRYERLIHAAYQRIFEEQAELTPLGRRYLRGLLDAYAAL